MSEMVERVALAIWVAREANLPRFTRRLRPDDIDRASGAWSQCLAQARAAIEAMRYSDADEDALIKVSNAERIEAVSLACAWSAMIDAALKE
jgi:hypothetical protein